VEIPREAETASQAANAMFSAMPIAAVVLISFPSCPLGSIIITGLHGKKAHRAVPA
jgi:hypothetical protein